MRLCRYKKSIKYLNKILFLDKSNIDAIENKEKILSELNE